MSVAARKPPLPGELDDIPQEAPRAPTADEWAAMTPAQRDEAEAALVSSESQEEIDERDAMAEGDPHLDAKMEARDTLRAHFGKRGRRIYVGSEIKVYYAGEKGFTPDIIAVTDVEPRPRVSWMVSREGKGIDLAMEIHFDGNRRKDFVKNVARNASLGIAEYFVYDIPRERIQGHRLAATGPRVYQAIRPIGGRYRSEVLDLDLAVEGGRLRFYFGTAELVTSTELVGKLERMVEAALTRAEQEQARTEQALARLTSAILMILRVRGLPVDDGAERRILGCSDLATLDRWLERAGSVAAVGELFEDA